MTAYLLYAATGAVAGFLAGLLGVGGGLIIVPALVFIFAAQGFAPDYIAHLALGTSLASIVFTSISSLRAHHRHAAVRWSLVAQITPGVVVGTLLGSVIARMLSTTFLKVFFVAFVFYVATQMLLDYRPRPSRNLPNRLGVLGAGGIIGAVSALVGIGGGTLSVPFMTWCNIRLHEAIGTSAAIGLPIALAGSVGYVINGYLIGTPLPSGSIGFVYLPALLGLVAVSVIFAPLGARTAHALPVTKLKKIFAFLLYAIGLRMASTLL